MEVKARNGAKSQGRGGTANGRQDIGKLLSGLREGELRIGAIPHPTNYRIKTPEAIEAQENAVSWAMGSVVGPQGIDRFLFR